jgi:DUF4097 and DUF4098 domain-containing protein YvlB
MDKMRTAVSFPAASDRGERVALWALLWIGLALMLLGAAGAFAEPTVLRTDRFSGVLKPGGTVRVDNVSGDIVAVPGSAFSAVVTVSVSAPTRQRAEEILAGTRVTGLLQDNEYIILARWPDIPVGGRSRRAGARCEQCKVNARIDLVLPHGVRGQLKTVNGEVRVGELDGDLELETVNGGITIQGFRKSVSAQTVNGRVEAVARALDPGKPVELETVNGPILLTLPKGAKFDLSASTMNGAIRSTFPLPSRGETSARSSPDRRKDKGRESSKTPRKIVVQGDDHETVLIDLQELEREIERSLAEASVDVDEAVRKATKAVGRIGELHLPRERSYSFRVGAGGSPIRLESLNGSILLLESGTREQDAKSLVADRRSIVVTVPKIELRVPKRVVRVVAPVHPAASDFHEEEDVVRGDVPGDFLSTSGGGNYRVGKVGGRVRILTHSGEIEVAGAGAGADLKTYGGDIRIGPVTGDLRAQTMAGDLRVAAVSGSASLETSGGDIRVERVGGRLEARTAGGDIIAPSVGGGVTARTAGGDVRIALASRQARGGVEIGSGGGDIVLTLPADFRGDVELVVVGAGEWDEHLIRSDFPEITISRRGESQRGSGALNGGGERVVVETSSGSIRVRKAPPAGS